MVLLDVLPGLLREDGVGLDLRFGEREVQRRDDERKDQGSSGGSKESQRQSPF